MINKYFTVVRNKLEEVRPLIIFESVNFDKVSIEMGIVKGRIVFIDRTIFEFKELISPDEHNYRFQWMNEKNVLISRWDTAPHHKEIKTFPFHQHLPDGVIFSEDKKLVDIIDIIKKDLIRKN